MKLLTFAPRWQRGGCIEPQAQKPRNNNSSIERKVSYIIIYYSKIPILRPPLGLSKSGLKDHF